MSEFLSVLPADIIRGQGVLYVGTDPYGASDGTLDFDPGKNIYNEDFDGKFSKVAGLDYVDEYDPKITGNLFPFSAELVESTIEPGSASAVVGGVTTVTPIKAGVEIVEGDLLSNVRLVFPRASGGYAWVKFAKALVASWKLQGANKKAAKYLVTIEPRLASTAALNDCPYVIETAAAI